MKKTRTRSVNEALQLRDNQNRIKHRTYRLKSHRQIAVEPSRKFKSKILSSKATGANLIEQIYAILQFLDLSLQQPQQQLLLVEDLTTLLKNGQLKAKVHLRFNKNGNQSIAEFVAVHYKFLQKQEVEEWVQLMSQANRRKFYVHIQEDLSMSVDYLTFKVVKILIGDLELLVESARLVLTMLKENKHVDIMLKEGLVDAMRQLLTKNIQRQFTYYQILAIMYCNRPNQNYSADLLNLLFCNIGKVVQCTLFEFTVLLLDLVISFPIIVRYQEIICALRVIERESVPRLVGMGMIRELRDTLKCLYAVFEMGKRYSVNYKPEICISSWRNMTEENIQSLQPYLNFVLTAQTL